MNHDLFKRRLLSCAERTEAALERLLPSYEDDPTALIEAMRYSLLGGGKRLRAFLTITYCELCGGRPEDAEDYAAALEMMHAFSLIHDDLPAMDNDTLRRGKPTNHVVYGEATALLAGDALAIESLHAAACNPRCSETQNLAAVKILSEHAGCYGMCGGQQIDLQYEHIPAGRDLLAQLVDLKTGALFAAACQLGCIAANRHTDSDLPKAALFAIRIGRAFQIADDLLDLHATAEELGKTPGKDLANEKNTFPALLGEEEARAYAASLCSEAAEMLAKFPDSESKTALKQFCDFILTRQN